jgi:hypothetical protein
MGDDTMTMLIWPGAGLTLLGLVGLAWAVAQVARARRARLDDAGLRAVLRRAVAINLGALGISALGLMMVVLGIML